MSEEKIVDLDVLAPKSVKIKFDGKLLTVNPPTLAQTFEMGSVGQKMSKFTEMSTEEQTALEKEINEFARKYVEGLDKDLNLQQIVALFEVITSMATPETTELEKKGIVPDTPKEPSES